MLSVRNLRPPAPPAGATGQHFDVLMELGDCHAALDRPDDAADCYTRAARLEPDRPEPHVGLGILALQAGRLDRAEQAFRAAADRRGDCAEAWGGLAMVRQQAGDYSGAFEMHLKCLELDTDNLVALLGLFQVSCRMGTFAKVIHYLELYLQRHPGDTSVLFCLATLYAREGRLDAARHCLLNVLALEPDKAEARQMLRQVETRADAAGALDALSA